MNTWQIFFDNPGRRSLRWNHYFPIYDKHFSPWKNKSLTFFEIGVFDGGSGPLWSKYFGTMATVVGIDINPDCKRFQTDYFQVRIGDQSDPVFLQSLIDEFGNPDCVLDDGSHKQSHIYQTFEFFYPKMHLNSVYMIEDLHCSYRTDYEGGLDLDTAFMNRTKNFIDQLNYRHCDDITLDPLMKDTFCVSCYDSVVVFEKGKVYKHGPIQSGCLK